MSPTPREKLLRVIDYETCIGCHTCEEVCSFLHDDETSFIRLYEVYSGLKRPISCFHCFYAPCVTACPTGAMHRDRDGAVVVDTARCIGCLSCLAACPFGIPELSHRGYVAKCDLCSKLRQQGLEPGCVAMCPARAIAWGKGVEVSESMRRRALAKILAPMVQDVEGGQPA
ncbi:MAG: ferredoxin [Crenarchaeota archaeon]|nr:ferredoxin [Thermoproteota archaeon]